MLADESFSDFGITIISKTDERIILVDIDGQTFLIRGDGIEEFKRSIANVLQTRSIGVH